MPAPMLRLVHTSDWHLGHRLHERSREDEHRAFLGWLEGLLERESADALLIAGDIFDTANPPAAALSAWYEFLARIRSRFPMLDVIAIGGNHDSPLRLDAPGPVLESLGVSVIGGLRRCAEGLIDPAPCVVPIHGPEGRVEAWCAAVPFVGPADQPRRREVEAALGLVADAKETAESSEDVDEPGGDAEDADATIEAEEPPEIDVYLEGSRLVFDRVIEEMRTRAESGQALVAMGHMHLLGGEPSQDSERNLVMGKQEALPHDLFPDDLAYVALGHLHRAQRVGGRDGLRYCGSPIPLSVSEVDYEHQVLIVDLEGGELRQVRSEPIPRSVEMLRIRGSFDEVIESIEALPPKDESEEPFPYLEVCVELESPKPHWRDEVQAILDGKAVRTLPLRQASMASGGEPEREAAIPSLREIDPREVFRLRYSRDHDGDPPQGLIDAFEELLGKVASQDASEAAP